MGELKASPRPFPLRPVLHVSFLYLRHKISFENFRKTVDPERRDSKPVTCLASTIFKTQEEYEHLGQEIYYLALCWCPPLLISCSSPVTRLLEAFELATDYDQAERERSRIASVQKIQSQSKVLILTISFVSLSHIKL